MKSIPKCRYKPGVTQTESRANPQYRYCLSKRFTSIKECQSVLNERSEFIRVSFDNRL